MQRLLIFTIAFLSLVFPIFFFLNRQSEPGDIAGIKSQSASVSVTVAVGEHRFTLFGYSSPRALVTLDGMGIHDQTTANDQGYFEFNNRFSPLSPREACLMAKDQMGRNSSPVCLPAFPIEYDANIGPVIMSPTISLNISASGNYYSGDEIILSGQTMPNAKVDFATFIDEKKSLFDYVFPSAYAYTFPELNTKADEKGNFSLSIPSFYPQFFRLFAQSGYQDAVSPESIRLSLNIFPIWMMIVFFIKPFLLQIIILIQLAAIAAYFLHRYLNPHVVARSRSLTLRSVSSIVKLPSDIIPAEKRPI